MSILLIKLIKFVCGVQLSYLFLVDLRSCSNFLTYRGSDTEITSSYVICAAGARTLLIYSNQGMPGN